MKFSVLTALAATLASGVAAQNMTGNTTDAATGLIQALQAANLTTLLSIAQQNAAQLLPLLLSGQPLTVFAPTDAAFAQLPENVTSDNALVLNTVLYHAYYGNYNGSTLNSNHTIARSVQNSTDYVNLPGGQGQVAVLTRGQSNDSVTVVQALSNVTSVASTRFMNIDIHVIPEVLSIPEDLVSTATAAELTGLVGALQAAAPDVIPVLNNATGITVFAPINEAFQSAESLIASLNTSTVAAVLLNHVVNGTVLYSTSLEETVSAGGSPLTFMSNSTGAFVMSGNASAQIVRPDIIIENGVVHLISAVLANTASNPDAAASAASSAASVGVTQTAPQTGPVGGPSATGSAGSPGSSAPASAGNKLAVGGVLGGALAVAALVF